MESVALKVFLVCLALGVIYAVSIVPIDMLKHFMFRRSYRKILEAAYGKSYEQLEADAEEAMAARREAQAKKWEEIDAYCRRIDECTN